MPENGATSVEGILETIKHGLVNNGRVLAYLLWPCPTD